jgi:hypothetical protein
MQAREQEQAQAKAVLLKTVNEFEAKLDAL